MVTTNNNEIKTLINLSLQNQIEKYDRVNPASSDFKLLLNIANTFLDCCEFQILFIYFKNLTNLMSIKRIVFL